MAEELRKTENRIYQKSPDSLLDSENISYKKKIFIYPVTRWQRI